VRPVAVGGIERQHPPPPRMGGMSSAAIGGFYEHSMEHSPVVHELVAKFADMAAKETAKEHGWQLKEATAYQRHRIRQRLDTPGAQGHGATSTKTKSRACPTRTPAPSAHARFATGRRLTRGGEQRTPEHSRTPLGRREWAAQQGAHALWRLAASLPPPPQPRLRESGGDAQRERSGHI
jgi:hypothetical protein